MPISNGENIRLLREEAGLSQAELARFSTLSRASIRRAEDGLNITTTTSFAIADALTKLLRRDVTEQDILFQHNKVEDGFGLENPEELKQLLVQRGITQKEVSFRTGISQSHLSAVLSGRRFLSPDLADRIIRFLNEYPGKTRASEWEDFESTPKVYNDDRTGRLEKLRNTAETIPSQSPLVRFGISENIKLNLVPTLADENDYDTIEALRSELLDAQGPIKFLKERYAKNPNIPQADLFGPLTSKYAEELSKDPRDINYTVLFARGSRFYAARQRAAQQIESGHWPELDADENESIDAICDLHGPMIMASAAGRKLVEDAHQYEVPPDIYAEDQKTIEEFGRVIAAEADLLEPETAEAYRELTAGTDGDPQPARSRGLGIAATGSALTVIVGGAAWYSAGGAVATFAVPAVALGAAGLVGGFFWEAIKTMPRFKSATKAVGDQFEKALDKAEKHADNKERALLKGMADLVDRKRPLFEKVANLRPEFGWARRFIKTKNNNSSTQLVDLRAVIEEAIASMNDRTRKNRITFTKNSLTGRAIVPGERDKLLKVFVEIIANAFHHGGRDVEVKISLNAIDYTDDHKSLSYVVTISDNGVGIRDDLKDRIFETGMTTSPRGSGTGLSFVKRLMEEYGVSYYLSSDDGRGATFTATFPALID